MNRIPEPGLWAVVEGWQIQDDPDFTISRFYLRESLEGEADWTRTSDGQRFEWEDIAWPILHREGLEG